MRRERFETKRCGLRSAAFLFAVACLSLAVEAARPGSTPDHEGTGILVQQEAEQFKDFIFTRAQVVRGEAVYEKSCASCHGPKLEGTPASALTGERFAAKWADGKHTVDDLYYITRTQMPYGEAGKLTKQQYIDVVAFMLNQNGYTPGENELPADGGVLRKLTIKPNDPSNEKTANKGERE